MSLTAHPASRAKTGRRPRLLSMPPKVRSALIKMVADGVPFGTACQAIGVPERTFQEWMQKGRAEDAREPYKSFAVEVEKAFALWQVDRVAIIAASPDPRAHQWLLERRNVKEWGDPRRGEVNVQVNLSAIMESPDWQKLRDDLVRSLAAYPDALATALRVMAGGDDNADVIEVEPIREIEAG